VYNDKTVDESCFKSGESLDAKEDDLWAVVNHYDPVSDGLDVDWIYALGCGRLKNLEHSSLTPVNWSSMDIQTSDKW
jgi:hypothetical protein